MDVVETRRVSGGVIVVRRAVDGSADRCFRGGVGGGDLDFLKANDVGKGPAIEAGSEGGE